MLFLLPVAVLGYQMYDKRQKEKLARTRRQEADHCQQDLQRPCKGDQCESDGDSSSVVEGDFHLPGESDNVPHPHLPLQGNMSHIPSSDKQNDQRHIRALGIDREVGFQGSKAL